MRALLGCELLFTRVLLLAGFACFTRVLRVLLRVLFTRAFSACSTALRARGKVARHRTEPRQPRSQARREAKEQGGGSE